MLEQPPVAQDVDAATVGDGAPEPEIQREAREESLAAAPSAPEALALASPRAGAPDGLDLPLPDKWFTAQELDVRAEPLDGIKLVYPKELVGTGAGGRVRIVLFIDERGVVRKTQIAASEPERLFDDAAINAWQDIRFSPAMKDGVAVKSQKLLEMDFLPF